MEEPIDNTLQGTMPRADQPMLPFILKFGLIGAGVLLLITILQRVAMSFGDSTESAIFMISQIAISLISVVIYTLIMFFSVRSYKNSNGGFVSLGRAFGVTFLTGLLMAVVNLILTTLFTFIYGFPQSSIEGMPDMSESSTLGVILLTGVFGLISGCFVGGFIALILSLIVKRDKPVQFNVN